MSSTVAEMSPEELREMIEASVERKLSEFFRDPDAGLEINQALREQLLRQEQDFEHGNRGKPLADIMERLDLNQDNV
jgi:chemotaxis methyl-accepting protein methylase